MSEMRIGEVAQRAEIPISTIRYYERVGVLPEPERLNGQRLYESRVLELLEAIQIAKQLNFTLDEIKLLLDSFSSGGDPSERCRALASQKMRELDQLIADTNRMKRILQECLSCYCTSLNDCYVGKKR